MMTRITALKIADIRFPTSSGLHGSDAMNPDPDYSCAYVTLQTSDDDLIGHGLTFTIGRGNDLCVAAVRALEEFVVGRDLDGIENDMAGFWRRLTGDSQLRWLGPEKGVVHLAAAAVINATWDVLAKRQNKPVWRYVADMSPLQLISALDFSYIEDFLPRERALEQLQDLESSRKGRVSEILKTGYPAYTTSAGWLGYDDATFVHHIESAKQAGWNRVKIKVGKNKNDDLRRLSIARDILGPRALIMIDANQVWSVKEAIPYIQSLSEFNLHWVEEPTSPDDILGHQKIAQSVAPIQLAGGEHCHNRIMFKQFLQANALSFLQVDACRLAGLNEVIVVALMAAEKDIPICPHAGGVGLCEYAQHLSIIDYICVSGKLERRLAEHAGQLHHVFQDPIEVAHGSYIAPRKPGFSVDMKPDIMKAHTIR